MAEQDNRVMWDCALLQASGVTSSIISPVIEAKNFELSPALVTFMERDQFGGRPSDNPNVHLRKFLAKCDIIKLNGVFADAIRLRLFPFSLKDRVSDWLQNEKPTCSLLGEFLPKPSSANTSYLAILQS